MAMGVLFRCSHCKVSLEAWDEGDPYYVEGGQKHYAYHPDADRDRCTGIDVPHLCLSCGNQFTADSVRPQCPQCSSDLVTNTFELAGESCPFCKRGKFEEDPNGYMIS